MGKYQHANALQVRIKEQNDQQHLKDKHNINEDNVIVVEKSNMIKFTVKLIILLAKTVLSIVLFSVAAVGVFTLLYPELRDTFFNIIANILNSIL